MHCCDVIGYADNGACYCDECGDDGMDPVFAEYSEAHWGATCDTCGSCYVNDRWMTRCDAIDPTVTRWAKCSHCGSQVPYEIGTRAYGVARAASLNRGGAFCHNCHTSALRF
jgi:hypothetical protein